MLHIKYIPRSRKTSRKTFTSQSSVPNSVSIQQSLNDFDGLTKMTMKTSLVPFSEVSEKEQSFQKGMYFGTFGWKQQFTGPILNKMELTTVLAAISIAVPYQLESRYSSYLFPL